MVVKLTCIRQFKSLWLKWRASPIGEIELQACPNVSPKVVPLGSRNLQILYDRIENSAPKDGPIFRPEKRAPFRAWKTALYGISIKAPFSRHEIETIFRA